MFLLKNTYNTTLFELCWSLSFKQDSNFTYVEFLQRLEDSFCPQWQLQNMMVAQHKFRSILKISLHYYPKNLNEINCNTVHKSKIAIRKLPSQGTSLAQFLHPFCKVVKACHWSKTCFDISNHSDKKQKMIKPCHMW